MARLPPLRRRRAPVRAILVMALAASLTWAAPARSAPDLALAAPRDVHLILMPGPGLADARAELYLEVLLNGEATRRVIHVLAMPEGELMAWAPNLRELGLQVDADPADRYLSLAQLPRLRSRYDALNQRLHLDADTALLTRAPQRLNAADLPRWEAQSERGALLNYDLYAQRGGNAQSYSGLSELRLFDGNDSIEQTGLSRWAEGASNRGYLRLDTAWTRASPDQLWSLRVGDLISGSLSWTRATRLGGIQLRRDFGLQPALLTYPLPQFVGEAALPSEVELYVNGQRQYQGTVQPGPFSMAVTPGLSGAGSATVIVTDALGRSRPFTLSFYNSPRLLQAGLHDYSVEAGAVRQRYGMTSFDYRDELAASGSYRFGLYDRLTLEAHAEADHRVQLAGAGAVAGLADAGTVAAAYAASDSRDEGRGGQISLDYSWIGDRLNLGYGLTRTHGTYRDLAAREGRGAADRSERALIGLALGSAGSLSLQYTRLDTAEGGRDRLLGLSYSVPLLGTAALYVSGTTNLDDRRDAGVFAGLSTSFGRHHAAGLEASKSRDTHRYGAYASRAVDSDGGLGWRLRGQQGDDTDLVQGDVRYLGARGDVTAGAWLINGDHSAYASASGALLWMDRDLLAARRIDDSFAVVSTRGVSKVTVLSENRPIGVTDAGGRHVLTGLSAYQPNQIGIDPMDVPLDHNVSDVSQVVVPARRAGVLVQFDMTPIRGTLLILHDEQGEPLPLGSRVRWTGDNGGVPVGYDGQAYVEALADNTRLRVARPEGPECSVMIRRTDTRSDRVAGPLICRGGP